MTSQEREKLFNEATMALGLLVHGDQSKVDRAAQEAPIRAALDQLMRDELAALAGVALANDCAKWGAANPGAGEVLILLGRCAARLRMMAGVSRG